ncbi:MAG: ABC transporter ATP-binding protein [Lachnospiraceae bacterium]|nr:ABC transporter ATP-binding protein [Lachnospiraceae bacterium]
MEVDLFATESEQEKLSQQDSDCGNEILDNTKVTATNLDWVEEQHDNVGPYKGDDVCDGDERKPVIEVKNLYKIYKVGTNKVRALNGVDFKVYEGEFCAIVGTSGSGKSTLLNMLAGLEKPTKGEILIDGQHIEKMNENQLVRFRRENVGFIFQSFNLIGTMDALENVALPLTFRGMPKMLRLKRAMKMLRLVGLKEHAKHRPNQMSGGQQQRVGMARALVVNPKIMFADEPTGNLDSHTSKDMMDLMRRIVNEQKKTLIMVTHDDSLAAIADKVIRIVDGKIVDMTE